MADLISVIVTTYNREDALAAVLTSLARQSDADFEVIVADDGSRPSTSLLVETWKGRVGQRLDHAWHDDKGFRAAEIRNRAILLSRGAYCIFLDGDCIARPDFVSKHRALSERGWFVAGNRVLLSARLTEKVLANKDEPGNWPALRWLRQRLSGGINRLSALMILPLGPFRRLRSRKWEGARSCNLAIWRDDLDRIDGFDADYKGWGKEDSDVIVRLLRAGVRRKDGNFATGVLHLHHAEFDRTSLKENEQRLGAMMQSDRIRAMRGLSAVVSN